MKIGEKIKLIRESKSISQQDLAQRIGKNQQDVSRWEKSKNSPGIDNLILICDGLGIELRDILGDIKLREIK